jgi:membrane-associated tyrosine/threonine-specific cdc2-inhibitory kinase
MLGDFPIPDFDFEDGPVDPCPVLFSPTPATTHSLTPDESRELSEISELNLESSVPMRCTSNSVVYKAVSNGQSFAVKITANRRRVEEEYHKRMELGNSVYLVRTISLQQVSNKAVLQMELCPFGDIVKLQMSEKEVWQLMNNIGNALEQIHGAGWMHLDVSPGNILRGDDHFKLADFGTLTKIGHFFEGCEGAGPYVSPEALSFPFSRYGVTGQTDVFSFGVVLLETLTGQAAPRGGSEGYQKLRRGEIAVGVRPYVSDCSDDLERIVNAMLNVNPAERPSPRHLVEVSLPHCMTD